MCVCCPDRRTGCSRARRAAPPRELSRHPRRRDGAACQTDFQPVPRPRQDLRAGPGHLRVDRRHLRGSRAAHGRRRGHVHLRGSRRRHAAVRLVTTGGAAAQDHHAGWRRHGSGHRVGIVPQRPAARVGARDGHPHRDRRGGAGIRRREPRPVPLVPQFLWHAGVFGAPEDRAGTGETVRGAAPSAVRLAGCAHRDDGADRRHRRAGRRSRGLPRRSGVQRRRKLSVPGRADRDTRPRQ